MRLICGFPPGHPLVAEWFIYHTHIPPKSDPIADLQTNDRGDAPTS